MGFKERIYRWAATRPTYQRYGVTFLLCCGLSVAWWFYSYRPLSRRYQLLSRDLVGVKVALPPEEQELLPDSLTHDVEQIVRHMVAAASRCGVRVELVATSSFYNQARSVKVIGSFTSIILFINYLETVPGAMCRRCELQRLDDDTLSCVMDLAPISPVS